MLDPTAMSPDPAASADPATRAGLDDANTSSDRDGAQMTLTREDDNVSMSEQSHSSIRAHYPADEGQAHEDGGEETVGRQWNGSEKAHQQQPSQQQGQDEDDQHSQGHRRRQTERQRTDEAGPACLLDFRDRVEACSHRVQAWADDQELKSRQRQERSREQRDGGVRIDADGRVIEPKGDNIAQRKGIIPLVVIILSWVYVAYVWRICVRGIQQKESAMATRAEAIGLLVGFHVLWLMAIWAYIKVILTKPGFVRDHFPISDPPSNATPPSRDQLAYVYQLYYETFGGENGDTANTRAAGNPQDTPAAPPPAPLTAPIIQSDMNASDSVDSKLAAVLGPAGVGLVAKANEATNLAAEGQTDRANESNGQEAGAPVQHEPPPSVIAHPPEVPQQPVNQLSDIPEPLRLPQTLMPLHPNNTYCYRCKRVKPPRAHHCRHCGTCVLKMDHHCPWVGGCVGAGNQKFFYHFLQWVTALELFVLVTNAIMLNRGIRRSGTDLGWPIDGYMISLVPLSAVFFLFTFALLITHSYLLVMNLTTIEHMAYDRQNTRENILVEQWQHERHRRQGKRKPTFFQQSRQRNQTKGRWATFWGKPKTEANPWWLDGMRATRLMSKDGALDGDARHTPRMNPGESEASVEQTLHWYHGIHPNWRQGMGDSVLGWVLPIGKARNPDGLVYEGNWRFGPYGEWTPRQHWASRLQPTSDHTAVAS